MFAQLVPSVVRAPRQPGLLLAPQHRSTPTAAQRARLAPAQVYPSSSQVRTRHARPTQLSPARPAASCTSQPLASSGQPRSINARSAPPCCLRTGRRSAPPSSMGGYLVRSYQHVTAIASITHEPSKVNFELHSSRYELSKLLVLIGKTLD